MRNRFQVAARAYLTYGVIYWIGGVYLAARERGLRIPDDLSVVGFDDLPFARVFEPPLTTIRIDPESLGGEAFEALAKLMAGESTPPGRILPVELVVRGSTAPPK